jgi:serine protease Do
VSFAVSSNIVQQALSKWRATGRVDYAWLGVEARTLSPQLAAAIGATGATSGALVQRSMGPALEAGIAAGPATSFLGERVAAGDIITKLGGVKVATSNDLARLEGQLLPGARVDVTFVRAGRESTATLVAARRAIQ